MWGGCAISIGWAAEEPLAVIVQATQSKLSMGKSELAAIYRRKRNYWEDGTKIQPVNLPADNPTRRAFSKAVLGYAPEELETVLECPLLSRCIATLCAVLGRGGSPFRRRDPRSHWLRTLLRRRQAGNCCAGD